MTNRPRSETRAHQQWNNDRHDDVHFTDFLPMKACLSSSLLSL